MRRNEAVAALSAGSLLGLLIGGSTHLLTAPICLAWLLVKVVVLDRIGFRLPRAALKLLHAALLALFLWTMVQVPADLFLLVLLTFAAPFLVLCNHEPPSVFNDFLVVLVAILVVIGSAATAGGLRPFGITAVFLFFACQALPVLSRRAVRERSSVEVRLIGRAGGWRAAQFVTGYHVALLGLLLGSAVYLLVPRMRTSQSGVVAPEATDLLEKRQRRFGAAPVGREERSQTGFPEEMRLGDVGEIKLDPREAFAARIAVEGRAYDVPPTEASLLLLRARVWTHYDPAARRWQRSRLRSLPLPSDGILEGGPAPIDWSFVMRGYDGRTLFLPQRARQIRSHVRPLFVDGDGIVTSRESVRRYEVESAQPVTGEFGRLLPDSVRTDLLRVPAELRAALVRLRPSSASGDIAAQVAALRTYFRKEGFVYTLQLPEDLPAGRDPILAFLEHKRGHCELFASAACLFLRLSGIPARMVGGLRLSERTAPGVYRARYRNAHAWVEIACREVGFVAVDFTPPDRSASAATPSSNRSSGDGAAEGDGGAAADAGGLGIDWRDPFRYGRREQDRLLRQVGDSVSLVPALCVLALLGAVLIAVVVRRASGPGRRNPLAVRPPPGVSRRTFAFYVKWLRACALRGFRRQANQTPREFVRVLPPELRRQGAEITERFERLRYGAGE